MPRWWRYARQYPMVALTLAVMATGVVLWLAGRPEPMRWLLSGYALFVVLLQARRMLADIRRGTWGIDILAVTAISATVIVGEYWAAVIVVLMLTGGEALEEYAAGRATRELTALLERAPQFAHRRGADGMVAEVPVEEVEVGDVLLVKPGEVVPVDAEVVQGSAVMDESSLTGESLPVEHPVGDDVLSGSVNGAAMVVVRATARAADSQFQRIVELVREAAGSKAPMVRLADRIAVPFTLFALALAGLGWWLSGDPVRFAEVLVVATPCPLLIAAPVAFMAGMSRSARAGIIVKNGGTLERLSRVRTVALDKTGTLTHGRPAVSRVVPAGGRGADEVLTLAASVEQYSGHALAASVVAAAQQRGLVLLVGEDVHEQVAHGVSATVAGSLVAVGKGDWVGGLTGTVVAGGLEPGEMSIHVAVDGRYAGMVALADEVRPEAAETIARLHRDGVRHAVMVTGDSRPTAEHVAAAAGITEVHAGCLPADKVRVVAGLPDRPVMMVGDGVNDAPVLAAADVGVAMGARGSSAAGESADVVILLDDVRRAAHAVRIGQRTTSVALQAIGIGVALSVVLMLVALVGYIPAVIGAALQEVVDLACILWALRASRPGREEARDFPERVAVATGLTTVSGR